MTLDFDDIFKEHVATYESHNDKLETLKWKRPGSSMYALYYVRWGGTLMVFGDWECAMYQWCPDGTEGTTFMRWIAERTNLSYFTSKCVAHPRTGLHDWSEEVARETMEVVIKDLEEADWDEEEDRTLSNIRGEFKEADGWDSLSTEEEWNHWLHNYNSIFGSDFWESCSITEPGKVLNPCILLHHEGLKRAMAQVKAKLISEPDVIKYDCCGKPLRWDDEGEPMKEHCEVCGGDVCPDCDKYGNKEFDYGTLCPNCYGNLKKSAPTEQEA